jgi:putative colanic acid biosynthesis acetyltransferase WcaF
MRCLVTNQQRVDLSKFVADRTYLGGRPRLLHIAWLFVSCIFFTSHFPWPSTLKCALLRFFGASIGAGVVIKPDVYVHVPWNLVLAESVWIGQGCVLLNFERITIGPNSALAHEVYLAAAGHDVTDPYMAYQHKPINIEDSVWVATRATVLAGVTLGSGCVVQAGAVVTRSIDPWTFASGVPARESGKRRLRLV